MTRITVLGASGFIGSHLVRRLGELGRDCFAPDREEDLTRQPLGSVIYCIGLTADFRSKPFQTVEAHVCKLKEVLRDCKFNALVYLSSTRLYNSKTRKVKEDDPLEIAPLDSGHLYNISKAMGESLCLHSGTKARIARLSNVYGDDLASDNFLPTIIKAALSTKKVLLQTTFDSEKDYICINDAVDGLIKIATNSRYRIYNLASGANVSNRALVEKLGLLTGCQVKVAPKANRVRFPVIDIGRMRDEFDFRPANILDDLTRLIDLYRR